MSLHVSQVAEGVHRFSSLYTNWYVIAQGGRLTVLDGGYPRDWRPFCSSLGRFGYTPADVDAVLVTHHHLDHAGNVERLRGYGANVYCHNDDAPYLRGEQHMPLRAHIRFLLNPSYAVYISRFVAKGGLRVPPVAEIISMSNGETLDVPGSPRVVHVPGHTAGSCALLLERDSVLFSGDSIVTTDLIRGRQEGPQIMRGPATEDADVAKMSLSALAATEAKTVLPGHGEPWWDGIQSAVEIARR